MGPFQGSNIYNMDETSCSRSKFRTIDGVAVGPLNIYEWIIDGRQFSAIAVYCDRGFTKWTITEETITGAEICDFVQQSVAPFMYDGSILIFDGASVHLTLNVINTIHFATNGVYNKVPAYAHHLSPIERGFSLVWRLVRKNWALNRCNDPKAVLNHAFHHYSVNGPEGYKANGHFRLYNNNNASFVWNL